MGMQSESESFDDLYESASFISGSSQQSLTTATDDLAFCGSGHDDHGGDSDCLSLGSISSEDMLLVDEYAKGSYHPNDLQKSVMQLEPLPITECGTSTSAHKGDPRVQIERIFEDIFDSLLNEKSDISITLKTRPTASVVKISKAMEKSDIGDEAKSRRICFPGRTEREAWRFTVLLRLLELIHEALVNNLVLSKRDIYYRDPALFGSQSHVDRYVDDLAFTFGVPRSALNVTAVAKGLVVGAITFCHRDGSIVNGKGDQEGMLVPSLRDILSVNMTNVKWILVVEKEASFRSIATSTIWNRLVTEGVLITGKGYPDIATRALLHFLATPSPQNGFASPPVLGLADFDPDGLAILSTYKHGSIALAHESADLRVSDLRWLGLRSEHVILCSDSVHATQGLLTLTPRNRRKARRMLECGMLDEHDGEEGQRCRELQVMLMLNVKAELQLLDAMPNRMTDLLQASLSDV